MPDHFGGTLLGKKTSRKQLVVSTSHLELSVIAPLIRLTALTQSLIWHDSDGRLQDFHNLNAKDLHLKRKSARKQNATHYIKFLRTHLHTDCYCFRWIKRSTQMEIKSELKCHQMYIYM